MQEFEKLLEEVAALVSEKESLEAQYDSDEVKRLLEAEVETLYEQYKIKGVTAARNSLNLQREAEKILLKNNPRYQELKAMKKRIEEIKSKLFWDKTFKKGVTVVKVVQVQGKKAVRAMDLSSYDIYKHKPYLARLGPNGEMEWQEKKWADGVCYYVVESLRQGDWIKAPGYRSWTAWDEHSHDRIVETVKKPFFGRVAGFVGHGSREELLVVKQITEREFSNEEAHRKAGNSQDPAPGVMNRKIILRDGISLLEFPDGPGFLVRLTLRDVPMEERRWFAALLREEAVKLRAMADVYEKLAEGAEPPGNNEEFCAGGQ